MGPSQLKIKSLALKRLLKEVQLYQAELDEQQQVVDKLSEKLALEAEGEEVHYELKKQVQVLEETKKMIPALQKKVDDFQKDLALYVELNKLSLDLDELKEAQDVLKSI